MVMDDDGDHLMGIQHDDDDYQEHFKIAGTPQSKATLGNKSLPTSSAFGAQTLPLSAEVEAKLGADQSPMQQADSSASPAQSQVVPREHLRKSAEALQASLMRYLQLQIGGAETDSLQLIEHSKQM